MTRTRRRPPPQGHPADAFALATAGAELALASLRVVNARTPMITRALNDPMRGDYAELSRMVSEKPLAFAQGAAAGGPAWLAMAAESNRYARPRPEDALLWRPAAMDASMNAMRLLGADDVAGRGLAVGDAGAAARRRDGQRPSPGRAKGLTRRSAFFP